MPCCFLPSRRALLTRRRSPQSQLASLPSPHPQAFPAGANDTALNNLVFRAVSREQLAGVRMGAPHAGVQY